MIQLTKQEQMVLALVLFLLITGWMVKAWRQSQAPPPDMPQPAEARP